MALGDTLADAAAEIREYLEDKTYAIHYAEMRSDLTKLVQLMEEIQERMAITERDALRILARRFGNAT